MLGRNNPDPSDFTGEEVSESRTSGLRDTISQKAQSAYSSATNVGSRIKNPTYGETGAEDSDTEETNKTRRNVLLLTGAGVGAALTGIGANELTDGEVEEMLDGAIEAGEDAGDNIYSALDDDCETGYGIKDSVAEEYELVDSEDIRPNSNGFYVVSQDSSENWRLEGFRENDGESGFSTVMTDVEDQKISEILNETGDSSDNSYEWGDEVVEYCLEE